MAEAVERHPDQDGRGDGGGAFSGGRTSVPSFQPRRWAPPPPPAPRSSEEAVVTGAQLAEREDRREQAPVLSGPRSCPERPSARTVRDDGLKALDEQRVQPVEARYAPASASWRARHRSREAALHRHQLRAVGGYLGDLFLGNARGMNTLAADWHRPSRPPRSPMFPVDATTAVLCPRLYASDITTGCHGP